MSGMLLSDAAIKQLGRLKQLRKLDLSNTQTADDTARELAGLTQLKVLHVYGTRITDVGMGELAKLRQLEELKIGYSITDAGVNALTGNDQLQVLSVWNSSGVGDGCVKALTSLTGLKQLDIGRTKISLKSRSEIRKALPGCKIQAKG